MSKEKGKSKIRIVILLTVLLVGGYFGFKKIYFSMTHETTDNAQVETQIIPVLPRVSGYIKMIAVKDFDSVSKGQLVAEIDDEELQAQWEEAQADIQLANTEVENAHAQLTNAISSLNVNKSLVALNETRLNKAKEDQQRDQNLVRDGAITVKQSQDSRFNAEIAEQNLQTSKREFTVAESRIPILKANLKKAEDAVKVRESKLSMLELKIGYTKIYAPQSGRIGKKTISEGQFVQAGAPLFSIVNDSLFWIVANFKENQVHSIHEGKKVDVRIDAYPDLKLKGTVAGLSEATGAKFALLPPDNSSGNFVKVTQRIPVKIWIDDAAQYKEKLKAGMSVFITVEND